MYVLLLHLLPYYYYCVKRRGRRGRELSHIFLTCITRIISNSKCLQYICNQIAPSLAHSWKAHSISSRSWIKITRGPAWTQQNHALQTKYSSQNGWRIHVFSKEPSILTKTVSINGLLSVDGGLPRGHCLVLSEHPTYRSWHVLLKCDEHINVSLP